MPDIAYQLYCSRNWPLADALKMLADTGYTKVEGYGGILSDPAALRAQLDALGLSMDSCHMNMTDVQADPEQAVETAKTLGIRKVFIPHIAEPDRPTTAAGWQAFSKRLKALEPHFADAGVAFGWHNHAFECELVDGLYPLDAIVEAGVSPELDLGWVARAGHDPVEWINKYGDKILAVHVKDIAPEGENTDEDGWADVGHGTLDWAAIHAALQGNGITHYVVEHDNPADHARFARRSLASINAF